MRWIEQFEEVIVLGEGDEFDSALIGVTAGADTRAVYDQEEVLRVLMEQGSSMEDAMDHFDYNVLGSQFEGCPIYVILKEDQ